jgi:hypothetical protein
MVTAIGGGAAKTYKHRTREAGEPADFAAFFLHFRRGAVRTPASRAPSGAAGKFQFHEGLPGADIKNTGDFARLEP